jgi:hypothetical protein
MDENRQLDLQEDEAFQKVEWRIQRIGWFIWAAILLAGLAGLLGPGPLSNAEATTPGGDLTVAYDRFLHYHQPAILEVELHENDSPSKTTQLAISQTLLDRIEIHRIEPEPERHELASDGAIYSFPRADDAKHAKILFHVEYERPGKSVGSIGLAGREPVFFNQFVYP